MSNDTVLESAQTLREELAGKPHEEVGWRDVQRLGEALDRVSEIAQGCGQKLAKLDRKVQDAQELATALERALTPGSREHALAEKLSELLAK